MLDAWLVVVVVVMVMPAWILVLGEVDWVLVVVLVRLVSVLEVTLVVVLSCLVHHLEHPIRP